MRFLDYIKGNRHGKEAHRIEKDSMRDPFLFDAIDGFDSVGGDHAANIERLHARLKAKRQGKSNATTTRRHPMWQAAAACGIIVLVLGGYLFISYQRSVMYAQEKDIELIEIYVPETFYEKNEVIIEEQNVVLAESYKPNVEAFKVEDELSTTLTKDELEILSSDILAERNQEVMDVYIPDSQNQAEAELELMYSKSIGKSQPINGFDKYNAYLRANMIRPTDGACADKHGKVAVEFSIDETGQPYQFVILYSLCGTSDKEAVRLIKHGPKWIPTNDRITVKVEF